MKPWERYQPQQDNGGPWAKYSGPKKPEVVQEQAENDPSMLDKAKSLFTGDDRREFDYPEIPHLVWNQPDKKPTYGNYEGYWPSHDHLATAAGNPLAMADIYEANVPGSNVEFDSHGNPYTTYSGNQYYLNRPGLSRADIAQVIPEALMYMGGGKLGAHVGKKAMGRLGQVVGAGAGGYSTSVAQDLTAQQVGSNQPIDHRKASIIAALGLGGEFAAPHIGRAYSWLKKVIGNKRFIQNGALTSEGRKAIESAGIDPNKVSREWVEEFSKLTKNEVEPQIAARMASSETLPKPIKLTQGQATDDLALQGKEQSRLHGVYGEEAQNVTRSQLDDQTRILGENAQEIQKQIGGSQVANKGEGASKAISDLRDQAKASMESVREAYKGAKRTSAHVPIDAIKDFSQKARSSLVEDGFDLAGSRLSTRLQDVEKITGIENVTSANLKGMELWRKRIVRDIESLKASDPSQAQALRQLKNRYDDFIKDSFENALIQGDQKAISLWQNARQLRASYGQVFEKNRIINKLVKGEHTPEETVNILFGAGRFGNTSRGEVVQALDTIQRTVGPNSWNALREEAFLRLLRNQGEVFSPKKFITELDTALRDGGTLMRKMFKPMELRLMGQLRDVAKATIYDARATNPSKSGYTLARIASDMFGPVGRVVGAVTKRFTQPIKENLEVGAARRGLYTPKRPEPIPGLYGGAGSFAGSQGYQNLEDGLRSYKMKRRR